MEPSDLLIKQTIVDIMTVLNNQQLLYNTEATVLFSKIRTAIDNTKIVHQDQTDLLIRTVLEIQRKTFNICSKLVLDVWKLFVNLQIKICQPARLSTNNQQQLNQSLTNLQDFYNTVTSISQINDNKFGICSPEEFSLFLTLWQRLFAISDLKSLQYAIISMSLILDQQMLEFNLKNDETQQLLSCINKMCHPIIKFNEKIKDYDTSESFNKCLEKIQAKFHKNHEKQISKGVKYLQESYKLSQVINYSNLYLITWQKLVLSNFLCASKKKKNIDEIQTTMRFLNTLKRTFFLERSINFMQLNEKKGNSSLLFMASSQIQCILFSSLVQVWVNFRIIYDNTIKKQTNEDNKIKLSRDAQKIRDSVKEMIKILTKRLINIQMARQLVKNLRILNAESAITQWKQILAIMKELLKSYPQDRSVIEFTDEKSCISKGFPSSGIKYPFTILLSVKGESIPFKQEKILIQFLDSSSKQKIIITMRNYEKSCMIFSFVKVAKNNIWGKQQKQFQWQQYEANTIEIVLKYNKIKMFINNNDNNCLTIENSLGKVDEMVLCDREAGIGSAISQLLGFKVIEYNIFELTEKNEVDLVPFICSKYASQSKDAMKENLKFFKCQKVKQPSFISLMQNLGDLELFVLILFHSLKKIKTEDELLQLIRFVLQLMQQFTVHKHVQHKQLTVEEKQARRKTIQCLGWFFAKESKSVFVIFELMRFLYIRGDRDNKELLKFLCNFSYWKQFKLDKQLVIVMKIKQLLKQSTKQEQKITNLVFCKMLLFDMILYFKQTSFKIAQKDQCLKLHQAIIEIVYEQVRDIIEIGTINNNNNNNNRKAGLYLVEIFRFMEYVISLISCLVNRKVHEDSLDLTTTVQLTTLLKDVAKLLFINKERKQITKLQLDMALQAMLKKQEQELILPLSLNAQQACDQRFSMYLGKLLSQTKSLTTLIDTEMTLFEQTQIKFYPIYADTLSICTEFKIHSNIINFGIYFTMLSEKSWNYMLFAMPLAEYTEKYCESLWRISFYDLFKDKKYINKVYKMLQHTPLPNNEYCLMKIFEAVLFSSHFQKQHLLRIVKSNNFNKSICPFKIQLMLIKYFNKLQPTVSINHQFNECLQEEKLYYVLLHAENADFDNCVGVIQCLKTRKTYEKYRVIIYEIIIRSLIKHIHQKQQKKRLQRRQPTTYMQSDVIQLTPRKRSRLYSNDQTQLSNGASTTIDVISMNANSKASQSQISQNNLTINNELAIYVMEALEFYLDSFTMENMKTFFGHNSAEDVSALRDNFIINVEGMMKTLGSQYTKNGSFQFEKYLSFIEVYLKKYSQHLIFKLFPEFDNIKAEKSQTSSNADVSKKGRNKLLYKTIHVDLIKHSTQFFLEEINHRRLELHTLEHTWSLISLRNNYFWNLFVTSEKYYSLSDITTQLGERFLLKISTQKPKIDLPKMINKHSLIVSVSMFSDKNEKNDESEPSTLFDDWDQVLKTDFEQVEAKTKDKVRKGSTNIVKQIKTKKFRVLLITNNKTYQGLLFMPQRNLLRFEENYPAEKFYDKIGAHEQQRRNDDEVEKQPMCFDVFLSEDAKIYHRRYLFFDTGLEVFANQKSAFFCFDNDQKRNRFCSTYLKDLNVLTTEKIKKSILQETSKWTKGLISNYDYLMKVNQHAGRSPNDLSQYYVMPWTIGEFQCYNISKSYLMQQTNFRDLTKPLGRLFEKKWKQIESRFKMSYGKSNIQQREVLGGIQPFLYGSFYSNPAIVTNYMIRVEPFSSLHYILQSEKIDLADRLFYQVSDQYLSLIRNMGDMKELIPSFYNNFEFLKNRSRINLGARQNKEIVNDVKLPKWAASAQEFIFKMRFFLQSPLVSKSLHIWIELIFGQKAKRQNALKFDNLFMSQIYGPKDLSTKQKGKQKRRQSQTSKINESKLNQDENGSTAEEISSRILFNKELGQLPLTLFDSEHPAFDFSQDYYSFKGIVEHVFIFGNVSVADEEMKINFSQNFCLVSTTHELELLDTGSQDYTHKENFKLAVDLCVQGEINDLHMVPGDKFSASLPYVFYINKKQKKLYSRLIKKSKFFGSLELRDEYCVTQGSIYKWIKDKILIVGMGNQLKVYSFDDCSLIRATGGDTSKATNMKLQQSRSALPVLEFAPFSQHKAEISFIETNAQLKLILTLDTMNRLFILKYYPYELRQLNTFELRWLRFGETVKAVMLHKLSIIVFFTSQNRVIITNFYGELIGAKQLRFKCIENNKKKRTQMPNCIVLFDENSSSQVLIGTNHGNLWKIDLFEFLKSDSPIEEKELWFQKISLNIKEQELDIKNLKVKRYGKHWQVHVLSLNKHGKKVISKVQCMTIKNIVLHMQK